MLIIGCDFHSRYENVAMVDTQTGEMVERRLEHENGEAQRFYAGLPSPARVGIEATGRTQWFERMLAACGHELWVGDAAKIRAQVVRARTPGVGRPGAESLGPPTPTGVARPAGPAEPFD